MIPTSNYRPLIIFKASACDYREEGKKFERMSKSCVPGRSSLWASSSEKGKLAFDHDVHDHDHDD